MVIPDSDIWIDYLQHAHSPSAIALGGLIEADDASLTGIVAAEVLRGARNSERRLAVEEMFSAVPYVEMTYDAWIKASEIARDLDAQGTPVPLPDVIVAALATVTGHEVFTRDKHFQRIPGLRLYNPDKEPSDA